MAIESTISAADSEAIANAEKTVAQHQAYTSLLESRIDYLESVLSVIQDTSTEDAIKRLVNTALNGPIVEAIKKHKASME